MNDDHEAGSAEQEEDAETDRVCRSLGWQIVTAASEEERAVLRCAISLASGAQAFEIDPVTGSAYTAAAFHRIAPRWAEHYAEYDGRDDGEFWQHRLMVDGRAVQAAYARMHPELAEPVWFPEHGPATCTVCLMNVNDAAGLPTETGLDPVTGRIIAPAEGAPRSGSACFKVEAAELKSALTHLVRIGDSTDSITLSAGPDTVELSVTTSIGTTPVQATSVMPATVTTPGRVALTLSALRAAARKDRAAPLLVDVPAGRVELGGTSLEPMWPVPAEDTEDPRPMLAVPIRRLARAVATADRLADPGADKTYIRDLWFALHPDVLTVTGTDRFRLAQTSIAADVLPLVGLDDPVRAFVPGAAAVAAAKMTRAGAVSVGADSCLLTLSAGPHRVRVWHPGGTHPDYGSLLPALGSRFAVRAGDLAELWGKACAWVKRIDAEATEVYRKSSGRIAKPDVALISLRLSRYSITVTVQAPTLRHYTDKKIRQIDDAHPGSLPGEYDVTGGMVEIALTPWALASVLHDADPDACLVLALPADPASRLLLVHTPGEVHVLSRAHTRDERFAARYKRILAELEASRAALAATAPNRKP
ncbi:hypothetical protein GCM10009839_14280 [Catenulispora yoronensis]|uniref:Uncharacterized protein n=1 Tax=Catenulispora yoronensis TaxID=450799 RepID=A0ABN2TRX4_9ACTN